MGSADALVALGLGAAFPPLIGIGSTLLAEALFLPLMLGSLAAVFAHRRSTSRYRWAIAAGALAGLSILTRSNAVLLLVPLAIGLYTERPHLRWRDMAPLLALVATAAVVVLPWTLRNAAVLSAFVPVSTQGSYTLAGTYNEAARLDRRLPAAWRPATSSPEYKAFIEQREYRELELGKELRSYVVRHVADHPTYPLKVGLWNTLRLLQLDGTSSPSGAPKPSASSGGLPPPASSPSIYCFPLPSWAH